MKHLLVFLMLFMGVTLNAQWVSDPTVNTPLVTGNYDEFSPIMVPCAGGFYVVYKRDNFLVPAYFVQRFNVLGYPCWQAPIRIIDTLYEQDDNAVAFSDGKQGVVIGMGVWLDRERIIAQRIDSNGARRFGNNGTLLCTASSTQKNPEGIILDDSLIFFAWEDYRASENDVYGAMLDMNGNLKWSSSGKALCTAGGTQRDIALARGNNSIILVWRDERSSAPGIYAQRVSAEGTTMWQINGNKVGLDYNPYNVHVLATTFGIYIGWTGITDFGSYPDIRFRKTTWNGDTLLERRFVTHGVQKNIQFFFVPDSTLRFLALYEQNDSLMAGSFYDDTVTQLHSSLLVKQSEPHYAFARSDTALTVVWEDTRFGGKDIYGQSFNLFSLQRLWEQGGVPISLRSGNQTNPAIVPIENGYVVVFQTPTNLQSDIYGQKLNQDGTLGMITNVNGEENKPRTSELLQNYPNPFNPITTIHYVLPRTTFVTLKVFNVIGQEVATLVREQKESGNQSVVFDASLLTSGIYYYCLSTDYFTETKKMVLVK